MLKTSDFYYDLPEELIAQTPAEPRDSSRMLVYKRSEKKIEHRIFRDIVDYLKAGDVLVINNTKVIPARLYGKLSTGGAVEVLLLKRLDMDLWETLVRPGRKCPVGREIFVSDKLSMTVEDVTVTGERVMRMKCDGVFEEVLDEVGSMPLPPYIKKKLDDETRYQTVYAKHEGSAAAPTAGLHFTPELLEKIKGMGVEIAEIMLHVGLGTFRPVKEESVEEHKMHTEYYEIPKDAAEKINAAKKEGRRIIAVGTTSVRTLESVADENGFVTATTGETDIFIYPPYDFKCVDALLTNFHLPESTLIMLVSAFCTREEVLDIYKTAVGEKYRFFSFGDCTLFL
ncbi:MAG: tRNA preQ1(34) S-adenosylmethionine ribosyltransferase-isomerase QueA [Clostridia bacterium]|nr:tRNA preQ1(34) S-adenosylmethionine ribosyltransferase-isomerase QueA [Clostridia bacterium]